MAMHWCSLHLSLCQSAGDVLSVLQVIVSADMQHLAISAYNSCEDSQDVLSIPCLHPPLWSARLIRSITLALNFVEAAFLVVRSGSHSGEHTMAAVMYVHLADEACCAVQYYNGQWTYHPQVKLGISSLSATRDLIEQSLRTQLLSLKPNVTITGGAIAETLLWDEQKTRVQGRLHQPGQYLSQAPKPLYHHAAHAGPSSALCVSGAMGMPL